MNEAAERSREDVLRNYYALCQLEEFLAISNVYRTAVRAQEDHLAKMITGMGGKVTFPKFTLQVESAYRAVPGSADVLLGTWITCKGQCPEYTRLADPAAIYGVNHQTWQRGISPDIAKAKSKLSATAS